MQILRAAAALLVVDRHAIEVVRLHQSSTPSANSYALDKFGACGVDIFFSISGFILATVILRTDPKTPRLALDFLTRRCIRIFPIYWIISIFFLVLAATHKLLTPEVVFNSYLLLPSGYPLRAPLLLFGWTLMFEMFFYYVLAFNLLFGKWAAIPRTMIVILLLVGLGSFVGFQRPILVLIANPMNLEFVMGCCIALLYARLGARPRLGWIFMMVGAVALAATVFRGYGQIDDAALTLNGVQSWARAMCWGLPAAILTAGIAFQLGEIRSKFGRFCAYLGDASYSIYLTSVVSLFVANRFYAPIASLPPAMDICVLIFSVTLIGTLTFRFIEQPITRYITNMYDRMGSRNTSLQLAGR